MIVLKSQKAAPCDGCCFAFLMGKEKRSSARGLASAAPRWPKPGLLPPSDGNRLNLCFGDWLRLNCCLCWLCGPRLFVWKGRKGIEVPRPDHCPKL